VLLLLLLTTSSRPENIFSHANEAGGQRAPDLNAPLNQICAHCWLRRAAGTDANYWPRGAESQQMLIITSRFISFGISHNILLHLPRRHLTIKSTETTRALDI